MSAEQAAELPDGVLAQAGPDLTVLVAVVGCAAAIEAAYNVGSATYDLLGLPLPLAIMFPLVLEAAAVSCAVQDLRDRRQGVRSRALAFGTYLGLAVSAVVNGTVGWARHGAPGLLEILPPVVLAGLIHVHGQRAVRAWQSRAVLRPAWRAEQLRRAQLDSAAEVLPLLTGDDPHGRATVALLRRRLESETLTPAEALLAAGWHDRHQRSLPAPVIMRLETVAATVWPDGCPAPTPARRPRIGGDAVSPAATAGRRAGPAAAPPESVALAETQLSLVPDQELAEDTGPRDRAKAHALLVREQTGTLPGQTELVNAGYSSSTAKRALAEIRAAESAA